MELINNLSFENNRIKSVIGSDRLAFSKEYMSLIAVDLKKVLEDYFEQPKDLELSINATAGAYEFNISGSALRLKPFNILPKG